ncbi:hypothetical protein [Ilyobacter polytropus]|uniref:Uncharacterized protein n=1 Tax=Ilyobacter polytropus (strain ATCC 51220 / DSM 2926 / LMG 16218 / CuHBu1) TaxID=572544 RepID=E3HCW7_ILYPC|nr:hypothetical protein [Ilyobacter polytropus]ADO84023.1 hypothetical protein Ilyop_2261 [Ilyobacter polytropus DSM 2926]
MNKKNITGIILATIIIFFSAVASTVYYTDSNLEMMWLFIFFAVPVFGLIFGFLVGGILKLIFKFSSQIFLYIIVFSFSCYTLLMTEEAFIGLVRNKYDKKTAALNKIEKVNPLNEIDLGEEKFLYYTEVIDETFDLNFNYKTGQNITRENIMAMADDWLNSKGYVKRLPGNIYIAPEFYRKMGFKIFKTSGSIGVSQKIEDSTSHPDQKNIQLFLRLKYKEGKLKRQRIYPCWLKFFLDTLKELKCHTQN